MDGFAEYLVDTSKTRRSRIILSADTANWAQLCLFLREKKERFAGVKIHPEHPAIWGISHEGAIKEIKRKTDGLPVILDAKLSDIENSNKMKAEFYFEKGYDALIMHAFEGKSAVAPVVELAREKRRGTFLVAGTTSNDDLFTDAQLRRIVNISKELGATGVISPGNDLERLATARRILGHDGLILSPGIGVQGGNIEDALRFSDFVIIGRSILRV